MKWIKAAAIIAALCIGLVVSNPAASFAAEQAVADVLTDEQKQEIAVLQKQALEQEKQVIEKYVEFGVFSEEKADQIVNHLEQRFEQLERDGFIPKSPKHSHPQHFDK
ncbi:YckD family protein [Terribacillus saccharophilus]|uniref:YckD family protein n=1 Tax=Terribacillus saccharophilus TaxID=361277 RepID=UPI003982D34A